eukprot:1943837-Prymnesium_polylepis.2
MCALGHQCALSPPRCACVCGASPLGEAKIDELDVALLIEQHILRVEVAVDDVLTVQVLHRHHHLPTATPHACPRGKRSSSRAAGPLPPAAAAGLARCRCTHLRRVEARRIVRQPLIVADEPIELAAGDKLLHTARAGRNFSNCARRPGRVECGGRAGSNARARWRLQQVKVAVVHEGVVERRDERVVDGLQDVHLVLDVLDLRAAQSRCCERRGVRHRGVCRTAARAGAAGGGVGEDGRSVPA